ncbi:MAG: endo-1,4-beta-xylanase [candidate division KSB1 bacterium]|nr:endo-1,4-beta-xylanase [candidate division KSB1 bacterium]
MVFSLAHAAFIHTATENPDSVSLVSPSNEVPVQENDILFYIIYLRRVDGHGGRGKALLQTIKSADSSVQHEMQLTATDDWQRCHFYIRAQEHFPAGALYQHLSLAFSPQQLRIGGWIGFNLGASIQEEELPPPTVFTYETEMDWKQDALARINQQRKEVTVIVHNKNGLPISKAGVNMKMARHLFDFGVFIDDVVLDDNEDATLYAAALDSLFNCATTPFHWGGNTDDWGWTSSEEARQTYRAMARWLDTNNIPSKGHALLTPGWEQMPSFIETLKYSPFDLRDELMSHLYEVVHQGSGFAVRQWDVVNEPYRYHDVMDVLGDDVIAEWFAYVHRQAPDAKLCLNESGVLTFDGNEYIKDNLLRLVDVLEEQQAPVDAIALQCQFGQVLTPIPRVLSILDALQTTGLPIQIVNVSIDIDDQKMQQNYLRDFMIAVFSHPAVQRFELSGFWQPEMQSPNSALFKEDWTNTGLFNQYTTLVKQDWSTRAAGVTDDQGAFITAAFQGIYDITVDVSEVVYTLSNVYVTENQDSIIIQLPVERTGIAQECKTPKEFRLYPAFPNPFNASTEIHYKLPQPSDVHIVIYNTRGQAVKTLLQEEQAAGEHRIVWNGLNEQGRVPASGVYLVRMNTSTQNRTVSRTLKLMYIQ